jgi:formylmethanofuran dehydrogenase subunit E
MVQTQMKTKTYTFKYAKCKFCGRRISATKGRVLQRPYCSLCSKERIAEARKQLKFQPITKAQLDNDYI